MTNLNQLIDGLESKLNKLLQRHKNLQAQNSLLESELRSSRESHARLEEKLAMQHEEITNLRAANTLLGSDTHRKQTKLKINALVRELDACITQLHKQT